MLDLTVAYCTQRTAFGRPIGSFQHNRFLLAEMDTEVSIAEQFVDRAVAEHVVGRFDAIDAAKAQWWTTELQKKVVDSCVQLHGGYGYMSEYPVAKARRQPHPDDLRRDDRGHEGDHRALVGV